MKRIFKQIWALYKKYEEVVNYLVTGVIGTIISIFSYWILRKLNIDIVASNVISWIITVIVMYVLNRIFVFKSKSESIFREFFMFMLARLFTLFLETGVIILVADVLHGSDMIGKVLGQIVVIVTNYLLSKFIIFKKDDDDLTKIKKKDDDDLKKKKTNKK